jgi:DNA modification methylase
VVPLAPEERSVLDKVSTCPIVRVPIERLRPSTGHARLHSDAKIIGLVAAIRRFGFVEPILVDQDFTIISGMARWMACQEMGVVEVPIIVISHLSVAEVRALRIALGRFPEWATWDRDQLRVELPAIVAELPDLFMQEIGFTVPEVDRLIARPAEGDQDPADEVPELDNTTLVISRAGDLWRLGQHLVLCGNALEAESYDRLLGSTAVRMVLTDPPYNVPINGHVTKRAGRFDEFAMASGEMTDDQFRGFLRNTNVQIARVSVPGAIGFFFIDWRHARIMQEAADGIFCEFKNHIVWVKDAPALGTFYRSQHEFVLVFKIADGKHVNNFALGQHGRTRSNVWHYAGMSSFGTGRDEALGLHATPKPVAMLVDAILDCSDPGDLVLDPFGGSGSTLIAAQRAHRRARLIEISPTYVDTIVRRWERFSGEQAVLLATNQTFAEVEYDRAELEASDKNAVGSQRLHKEPAEHSEPREAPDA